MNLLSTKKETYLEAKSWKKRPYASRFKFSKRAVRERYTLLSEKFKAEMKDEERASGIECDLSEVVKALEETSEKEAAAEDTVENDKKVDNAKAAEMRNKAQESLSGT